MIKAEKYLGFDDRWLILSGIPLITILVNVLILGVDGFTEHWRVCLPIGFINTTGFWFGFRYVLIKYHKRYSGYTFDSKRLFFVISRMGLMYIIVDSLAHFIINNCITKHDYLKKHYIETDVVALTMIALAFFLYEGIYYFNRSRMIEIEKNKLEKITAEQKLSTLKNQVNPHFLFNSLNTLVTMIPEEPELAINFVQKLSKTYRNILELRDEKLIPLEEELKALDSYIYLLKTRFQAKIQIFNTIPETEQDHFILPLSLQILIENAVKHNITSASKPLKIELFVEDEQIVVRNNLQKKNQKYNSTKMGLANIRSRYKLLAEKEIKVEESETYFTVKLPFIKNTFHESTHH